MSLQVIFSDTNKMKSQCAKESVSTHTTTPVSLSANADYKVVNLPVGLHKSDLGLEITP